MKDFYFFDWKIILHSSFRHFANSDEFIIINDDNEVITTGTLVEDKLKLTPIRYDTKLFIYEKTLELNLKVEDPYLPLAENFETTILIHDEELDGLSNKEKIKYLINSSCVAICDSCLSDALDIESVNQVNQICNKLKKENHLRREDELCPLCNKIKKCNRKFV
ncbi:MAG: hypothetical protein ACRDCW_07155 [Sarcina sp.]